MQVDPHCFTPECCPGSECCFITGKAIDGLLKVVVTQREIRPHEYMSKNVFIPEHKKLGFNAETGGTVGPLPALG
jgi:hypothetical protein